MAANSPKPPVTQAHLAEMLGVSQVSIHKALTNQSGVSEKTRQKVLALAQRYGYRLNVGAKAMRGGSLGCIGLLLSEAPARSVLPPALLDGIQRATAANDFHLVISALPDEKLTSEGYVPKILREVMADGLLINYNARVPKKMVELIRRHGILSIWINSKQPRDGVYPDDIQGARLGTQHLLNLGHRRIVYLDYTTATTEPVWHYSGPDRLAGYEATMREAGLQPQRLGAPPDWVSEQAVAQIRQLLSEKNRPTAIFSYSIRELRAVIVAAAMLNLRIPEDLSVATFAGEPLSELGRPISSVMLPERELGESAVRMLLRKLSTPNKPIVSESLPCTWREGRTVAQAPQ
jgi:LacI family transcriptional regulator